MRNGRNNSGSEQKRRRITPDEQSEERPEKMMSSFRRTKGYVLSVEIKSARNADAESTNGVFNCSRGLYQVCVTESQNLEQFRTDRVRGDTVYPSWNQVMSIGFEKLPVNEFLFLEVLQFGKLADPTTSSGAVVVGRAMIPVPVEFGVLHKRVDNLICVTPSGETTTIGGVIFLNTKLRVKSFWD